jgi:phage terminase large subunit-like protein
LEDITRRLGVLSAEVEKREGEHWRKIFRASGALSREHYPKHVEVIEATRTCREVLVAGANRVGKSELGAYLVAVCATGEYPGWWSGKRFDGPVQIWVGSDSAKTLRDPVMSKLLGPSGAPHEGTIPPRCVVGTSAWTGLPGLVEMIRVRHESGGVSTIGLRSYDQGREAWQGTSRHLLWLDEEPPEDVYGEALLRTLDCNGVVLLTMTPMQGWTRLVEGFLSDGGKANTARHVVTIGWDDVPHLDAGAKADLAGSIPAYQRDARMKGIPMLGAGAIYPVPESEMVCAPVVLAPHWPRVYGMDVGWNRTAAVWGAWDRDADVVYVYAEHSRGQAEPSIHADAIRARGAWVPGVIDPASRGRSQGDGTQLIQTYRELGLHLVPANNAVEAGI